MTKRLLDALGTPTDHSSSTPASMGTTPVNTGASTSPTHTNPSDTLPFASACAHLSKLAYPGSSLVISATPGSGKTTLAPTVLADRVSGRVLVTQPRRVAARAGARRIAQLLGEPLGPTVGYSVRADSTTTASTRIEFLTPGLLLRRLQSDPELPGVDAILFDEFHERHIDTDLALAFALDIRSTLREDLILAVTSATVDTNSVISLFEQSGLHCQHLHVDSTIFPIDIHHIDLPTGVEALYVNPRGGLSVTTDFVEFAARIAWDELNATIQTQNAAHTQDPDPSDITPSCLLFLPGVSEINRACTYLNSLARHENVEILPLHGGLSPAEQDRVFTRTDCARVIVSSALAESSVTVPGVSLVVDSGLSREPRVDNASGVGGLTTVWSSRASATQRAGRSARERAGRVVRLGNRAQWEQRPQFSQPEMLTSDLLGPLLQASVWSARAFDGLSLIDKPTDGAVRGACQRLQLLGALDADGAVTVLGRQLAFFPVAPHVARAAVVGAQCVGAQRAALLVACVAEQLRTPGADLASAFVQLRRRSGEAQAKASWANIRVTAARIESLLTQLSLPQSMLSRGKVQWDCSDGASMSDEDALAWVAACAFPMWVARARRVGAASFVTVQGVGLELPAGSALIGYEWLAVTDVSRQPGQSTAIVRSAVPLSADMAVAAASFACGVSQQAEVMDGRIRVREREFLGAITLKERIVSGVSEEAAWRVLNDVVRSQGVGIFSWSDAAVSLRQRVAAVHRVLGEPWPDVSDEALAADVSSWLNADVGALAAGAPLDSVDMFAAMQAFLPWPQASRLDELAPLHVSVPVGGTRLVDWSGERPVVALRVQEAFGWVETPRWADGQELFVVHLLDPAGRPVAVTSDLASFWAGPYQQVRAQLRGRYTKHPWPEDPLTYAPTSRANPRRR